VEHADLVAVVEQPVALYGKSVGNERRDTGVLTVNEHHTEAQTEVGRP
jgi:hypothetical protein